MMIYPTLELQNGKPVSLYRGRLEEPQIWHVNPIEKVREFAAAGAEWVHVTDFDGIEGSDTHTDLLIDIIRQAGVPIQLGGGFRSMAVIEKWIDLGVGRVVLGTMAVTYPDLVKQAAKYFPDQIVLAIDVFEGKVMSDGWRQPSVFEPEAFLQNFLEDPLAAIVVSDISADIGDTEEPLALITKLAGISTAPVIARGLSRTIDDLSRMKYVPYLSGAIVGRAFFDKTIDLEEAFALATAPMEPRAAFQ